MTAETNGNREYWKAAPYMQQVQETMNKKMASTTYSLYLERLVGSAHASHIA